MRILILSHFDPHPCLLRIVSICRLFQVIEQIDDCLALLNLVSSVKDKSSHHYSENLTNMFDDRTFLCSLSNYFGILGILVFSYKDDQWLFGETSK